MKDKHAQTHVFSFAVVDGLRVDVTTIEEDRRINGVRFDRVPNIFGAIDRLNEDGERPVPFYYATPDYMDAILALFVLVEYEYIDACDANDAAMMFTEAFYGFETK